MRTALLCNDTWHPAEILRPGFAAMRDEAFGIEWLETPAQWVETDYSNYNLIVLAKGNTTGPADMSPWITSAVERALVSHVERGRGLAVVHAGTAGYKASMGLRTLLGGGFVQHPPPCEIAVHPTVGHPLTGGVGTFSVVDEHYFVEIDPGVDDIFLRTQSAHGTQPAGWRRQIGSGRVWVCTLGHTAEVWRHPDFLQLLRQGLRWAAHAD